MPALATTELPDATAVVLHDAGAANLVLAWVAAGLVPAGRIYAEGPAARLCEGKLVSGLRASLEDALDGAEALLSGTGWASELEHRARHVAQERGLHSVAVIDHWVNYRARFERHGSEIRPDEVWVTDEFALAIARDTFPNMPLRLLPNLYLEAAVASVLRRQERSKICELLYVLEPARNNWGRSAAGEFQALDYLVEQRAKLGVRDGWHLRLRPHPSDPIGKYDDWIKTHSDLSIELDSGSELSEAIARAAIVAGCNSFAMVVALTAGRRTVCTLPPWAPKCALPHDGLIHLKDIP